MKAVSGHVVIRMRTMDDDEDGIIRILPENAYTVAQAIVRVLNEIRQPLIEGPDEQAGPKDPTAAERQRRRRQRLAEGEFRTVTNDDVTASERDMSDVTEPGLFTSHGREHQETQA